MSGDLYVQYTRSDPALLVARAVARDLLEESEVPKPLLSALRDLVTYWREHAEEPDTA